MFSVPNIRAVTSTIRIREEDCELYSNLIFNIIKYRTAVSVYDWPKIFSVQPIRFLCGYVCY